MVALSSQQIEFDVSDFAFEKTGRDGDLIQSPNIEPANATSSYSYSAPFSAKTITSAEVTTSNISFSETKLSLLKEVRYYLIIVDILERLSNIIYSRVDLANRKVPV